MIDARLCDDIQHLIDSSIPDDQHRICLDPIIGHIQRTLQKICTLDDFVNAHRNRIEELTDVYNSYEIFSVDTDLGIWYVRCNKRRLVSSHSVNCTCPFKQTGS